MTEEKPLTREHVLRLIEQNGGTARGLDLSGRNLNGINLLGMDLRVILLPRADLRGADLSNADLRAAFLLHSNLQGANLSEANLEGASLDAADLQGSDLSEANLRAASLHLAKLRRASLFGANLEEAHLEAVQWGHHAMFLGPQFMAGEETRGEWILAERIYRSLENWHREQGMYDIAGDFFLREMTAKRKQMKRWGLSRAWLKLVSLICGYGEIPERTVAWGACWLLGLALVYFFLGAVWPFTLTLEGFLASLYYSAVSFTSLGYGPWFFADSVRGWAQGVGAFESIMGAFTIALFLVTFTRKMTRS